MYRFKVISKYYILDKTVSEYSFYLKDLTGHAIYKSKNDNFKLGLANKVMIMMMMMVIVMIISLMTLRTVKDVDSVKSLLLMGLVRRKFMRDEVFMAVSIQITVFWALTCSSLEFTTSILYREDGGNRFLQMMPATEPHSI